jgi:16S rRNA (adenine1518-N6/adenine1519-N6)-dimethyltransferase
LPDPEGSALNYNSGPALRALLESRGLSILKKWGQNFLVNPRARQALVDALDIGTGDGVWEIGPGMGAMTALLLEKGAVVRAFEIDRGLALLLEELFGSARFTLIRGDVLKTWEEETDTSPYLLGNLPYAIAALLVGKFIEKGRFFKRMVITVQKEVALRMAARPGSKDYSSISVLCSSAYTVQKLMTLKGPSFYPPPHVESAALCLTLRGDIPGYGELFFPLVRSLFNFRRKTVANNLGHFLAQSCTMKGTDTKAGRLSESLNAALEDCGIRAGDRAENLGQEEFFRLSRSLEANFMLRKDYDCRRGN